MTAADRYSSISAEYHGLLGTVIQMTLLADDESSARAMESAAIAVIEQMQGVFDLFDANSRLCRWQRGEVDPGFEIQEVLERAEFWRRRSGGAFDANAGALIQLWSEAAAAQKLPAESDLRRAVARDDPTSKNLNGIAKGWIIDCATTTALEVRGAVGVTLNAGGDIRQEGPVAANIGVEDPNRPYDNIAPLCVVRLETGALASSGGSRRGWKIDGVWYSHVIDPRTGMPAGHVAQASVIAPTAGDADAIATALTVLHTPERRIFAASLDPQIGYMIIDAEGRKESNSTWDRATIS